MLKVRVAVFSEHGSTKIGYREAACPFGVGLVFEDARRERPMAHRLHHVLTKAEVCDARRASEYRVQVELLCIFIFLNSIDRFLEPSISEGKRFVASKL